MKILSITPQTAVPIQFKKGLLNVCSIPGVTYLWFCNVYANSALEHYILSSEETESQT
jgi:hypothetical protein